jgi:hypothetical protein
LSSNESSSLLLLLPCNIIVDVDWAVLHLGQLWKANAEDRTEKSIMLRNCIILFNVVRFM